MRNDCAADRRRWLMHLAGGVAALACPSWAGAADAWPTRPVRIVIAVAAGSSGDTLARILAPRLEALWKQPVIVENKPGASGIVGTEYVAGATDGHTLLLGTQSSILPKFTQKTLRFDPLADLVPVYKVINYEMVIATNAQTAAKAGTLADLVKLSKSTDKGLFFAGTGPTSIFNLSMAILNRSLGLRYTAVDFNNIGAMTLALLRDDGQVTVNTPSAIKAHIESGAIVPLAAVSATRYPDRPSVPTLQEAVGYKGYLPLLWAGMFVPKSTPARVVDRISRDLLTLAGDAAVQKQIESTLTGTVVRSSPAAFSKEIQDEVVVWKEIFQLMNFKPE
ncbi:tripartite tricarboxylate transporter substrate binding protein [Variovorax sp. KK3]|uniref:Bug family tripartite tricarboxylate transporter substrate binding protein n=1 Tax=Variovorax sp. KK3 TaxID=1855728 RepID=UPI00097C656D|nr:tripartite tricarboxylate transporter substrate binding protein [Variovorax sp. KK3]